MQDKGLKAVINAGLHLQAEKGELKRIAGQFDHVLGGGDDAVSAGCHGIFLDLEQDARGVALMILEAGESGEGDTLIGQAPAE